ncbi:MAG: DUF2157 domain-containing protein [Azoarcus sp.]|jgi:uncharacterized membrane protein|nr:DUF2157 domain-containing protein [Azoarcus sp.]
MERSILESKYRFLSNESQIWVEQGVISAAQRDGIMGSYTVARYLSNVVLILGAAMVGIGILSIIAANWDDIPRLLKISLIIGLYLASILGAYVCEKRSRPVIANVLLFLSGFLLLGGLALLSQIFHISGTLEDLLWTWLIIYAPTFLITRNISIFVLYEVVAIFYMFFEMGKGSYYRGYDHIAFGPWQPFAVMLLVMAVAWRLWHVERGVSSQKKKSKLQNFFIGGSTRRIMLSNFMLITWFLLVCSINARGEPFLMCILGVLAIGAVIGVIAWKLDASDIDWQSLVVISICGVLLSFEFIWSASLFSSSHQYIVETVGASAALGVYLSWRVLTQQRGGGWAVFFFCAILARWYFDMFFAFMDKGVFFLIGGVLLIAISAGYAKWHRRVSRSRIAVGEQL